ncbi:NUDIX hydrolase [Dyadobacter psychrotolerans]|uniref:NUDIX domain-containing protein n=1 Tax=Dyadobacter psychrotolerans TaxID=2541721 RepID=A0A4R5DK66_9BACT|nr:NUDIX hydrolase [Dyadobacter psychrotolerans]TDE11013.1 NUDIX domain-containing protein [Dyadobacter psychrotolerans]
MTDTTNWLRFVQRFSALAETGLAYSQNDYDKERYAEIKVIGLEMLANMANVSAATIIELMPPDKGYQTPKVDIRAVVLNASNELLMVQEKVDENRWSLPGGWADIGYTPFEVAEKEVFEETGLEVKATRLLAVFDKKMHPHPPQPWYVYKFYILCQVTGGELLADTIETGEASWIDQKALGTIPFSTDRITLSQLKTVLRISADPNGPTLCD